MDVSPSDDSPAREAYREQLRRVAHALATVNLELAYGDLEHGSRAELMKMFVDGNVDKRVDKLATMTDFLLPAFGGRLRTLITEYVRTVPLAAYDSGPSDADGLLEWIQNHKPLTDEQFDSVACQRARWKCEQIARSNRFGHVRFQDLRSLSGRLVSELDHNASLRIHLNPVRTWTRFYSTELIGSGDEDLPVDVMVFAVGNETTSAVFDDHGRLLLEELGRIGPCTIATWAAVGAHAAGDELMELCRDLADMGLVAFS